MGKTLALRVAALIAATSVMTAGCSTTEGTSPQNTAAGGAVVTVSDQWVKAAPSGMSGMFATLTNSGDRQVTLTSASSPVAGMVELHEVVGQAMQPKQGGFPIPAGGTHVLAPGADHIMLMELKQPLRVGDDVEVTLTFDDGSTLPVTAQVRDFSGAGENYQPGGHG